MGTIGQNVDKTSDIVVGNSETFISFGAWDVYDTRKIKSMCSLSDEQAEVLKTLPLGFLIGRVRSVWPHAMLGYIPEIITKGCLSEEMRKQMMEPIITNIKWRKADRKVEMQNGEVSAQEKAFLFEIYNHPFTNVTEKYKQLNLSASVGTRIVSALERKGFVRKHNLNLGYRGGVTTFLSLTDEAFKILNVEPKPERTLGGGFLHQCCCHLAKQKLEGMRKDWKVSIEKNIRGKSADILIELPTGEYITFEIGNTTSAGHERDNALKNLQVVGADFNITALVEEKNREELKKLIALEGKEVDERTAVCSFAEFMRAKNLRDIAKSGFLPEKNL